MVALVGSVYVVVTSVVGHYKNRRDFVEAAERGVFAVFALVTLSVVCLWVLLGTSDFNNEYVASYTNEALPMFYKLSALWGGMAGSLLFWTWILVIFCAVATYRYRRTYPELMPMTIAVFGATMIFFVSLNLFGSNPFQQLMEVLPDGTQIAFTAADGRGLNPLLQHPAMVIHPPVLYTGYVGFIVPFAFALAALITGKLDDTWAVLSRRWTLFAWFFLSAGILLGGKWAYVELGWGGYWAWDPVENASLMPWIIGTAFLHSIMIQEKKNMFKVWNIVLVISTYLLCIFGTFLTRSGIVSSVHAFAQGSIGQFFAAYILLSIAFVAYLIGKRLPALKSEEHLDSAISRESGFLVNNFILVVSCFAILWGTIFPVISEAVTGEQITVGIPFFNKVNIPIGLFLLFLTGIGPLLAWRHTSVKTLKSNFLMPTVVSVVAGVLMVVFGITHFYALVCFIISVFVTATIGLEFYRGMRSRMASSDENFGWALINLVNRNKRRYGGYIVHLGMVVIFVGIAGQAFNIETQVTMAVGDQFKLRSYTLVCEDILSEENDNYFSGKVRLALYDGEDKVDVLFPERRVYKASEQPSTEVEIYSKLKEDLYLVYLRAESASQVELKIYVNPLVSMVWLGGLVLCLGTIICILPEVREDIRKNATVKSYAHDRLSNK